MVNHALVTFLNHSSRSQAVCGLCASCPVVCDLVVWTWSLQRSSCSENNLDLCISDVIRGYSLQISGTG